MKTIQAYHFTGTTLRNGDPIPKIGKWLKHTGLVIPCESGLHASEHPFDALQFAPGPMLHLVELRGDIQTHGSPVDKIVGRERRILASIVATELLRYYARMQALSVTHLWDPPDLVLDYLMMGDETIRAAARAAAWAAAGAAAGDAAGDAARAAAGAATWAAARAAARAAFKELVEEQFR